MHAGTLLSLSTLVVPWLFDVPAAVVAALAGALRMQPGCIMSRWLIDESCASCRAALRTAAETGYLQVAVGYCAPSTHACGAICVTTLTTSLNRRRMGIACH